MDRIVAVDDEGPWLYHHDAHIAVGIRASQSYAGKYFFTIHHPNLDKPYKEMGFLPTRSKTAMYLRGWALRHALKRYEQFGFQELVVVHVQGAVDIVRAFEHGKTWEDEPWPSLRSLMQAYYGDQCHGFCPYLQGLDAFKRHEEVTFPALTKFMDRFEPVYHAKTFCHYHHPGDDPNGTYAECRRIAAYLRGLGVLDARLEALVFYVGANRNPTSKPLLRELLRREDQLVLESLHRMNSDRKEYEDPFQAYAQPCHPLALLVKAAFAYHTQKSLNDTGKQSTWTPTECLAFIDALSTNPARQLLTSEQMDAFTFMVKEYRQVIGERAPHHSS